MSLGKHLLLAALICLSVGAAAQSDEFDAIYSSRRSTADVASLKAQADAEPTKTDDRQELSIFYHKRGVARHRLGNYPSAIVDLKLALEFNQPNQLSQHGWGDRSGIQSDLGMSQLSSGQWFAQVELWTNIAEEYRESNLARYHGAQLRITDANLQLGDLAAAEKSLNEANATLWMMHFFSRNWGGRVPDGTISFNNSINAHFMALQGNYADAERLYRLALENEEKSIAAARNRLPDEHQNIRREKEAMAWRKRYLAEILATRNKPGEAEFYARAALLEQLDYYSFNTDDVSQMLAVISWTKVQQADLDAARKYAVHALAALQGSDTPPHSTLLADRRATLANVLLLQSRWEEALSVWNQRDQGLRSDASQFERTGSQSVEWAFTLHKTGQAQRAIEIVQRLITLQLKRTAINQYELARLRGVLGMAKSALGDTLAALPAFRESVPEIIRRDQDDAGAENSSYWRTFWRREIIEGYIELLGKMYVAGSAPAGIDVPDEIFRMADLARGSSVQDAISASAARAQLPDKQLSDLVRRDQDSLNRIVALNQLLARLVTAPEAPQLSKPIGDLTARIAKLREERIASGAEIRKRFPGYADLIDPQPAHLSDVRKALAPGEALVSIFLGNSEVYVWTVGESGTAFRMIPVARTEVEAAVTKLRTSVEFGDGNLTGLPAFDFEQAYKIFRLLLAPDESLWANARTLNYIPHGALGQLPFSLLITELPSIQPSRGAQAEYREASWLMRKIALAQLPSASAYLALRRVVAAKPGREPLVGFGNPLFSDDTAVTTARGGVRRLKVMKASDDIDERLRTNDHGDQIPAKATVRSAVPTLAAAFTQLSPLPDTEDELREIASALQADTAKSVFTGRLASEATLKRLRLDNRRVVVFATHSIAPGELTGLDQPALVLSNPALTDQKGEDGFLTMEEILGLQLDADWVVLSACNTASADGKGSEAVSGLGRAFFYAGARSLLVSNWAVETSSARLLTTELFKRQSANPNLTRAEALRQAMLSLIAKDSADTVYGRPGFSYAHPAFWAPFSLVGDGR